MQGILLVDKPIYWSSFDVIRYIRKIIASEKDTKLTTIPKIGHAGTLDPIAQGLLILCFGKTTKQSSTLMNKEKEYIATIKLGEIKDTDDITGKTISSNSVPKLSENKLKKVLSSFTGEINQIPPFYSALKVKGIPLYKSARAGKNIQRHPRKVEIKSIELQTYATPLLTIKVICGKGTYIRAIARDLGEKIGCGACMSALTRTRIGEWTISSAINPYEINSLDKLKNLLLQEEQFNQKIDRL